MNSPKRQTLLIALGLLVVGDYIIAGIAVSRNAHHKVSDRPAVSQIHPQVLGQSSGQPAIRGQTDEKPAFSVTPVASGSLDFSRVGAKSFLVYDMATKTVLAERNVHEKTAIASLTKLLTALVVYKNSRFDDVVRVEPADIIAESPVLGLKIGDQINVGDLFSSMLVGSANDSAAALAHYVQKAKEISFPILMNSAAKELGMFESSFSNPLGFDSVNNFSTAHDLFLLTNATRKYSAFLLNAQSLEYRFTSVAGNSYKIKATNQLIGADPEIFAIKTGFTLQAKGAMITSAVHDGHEIILIVLKSDNREGDTLRLKDEIFSNYRWE